MHSPPPGEAEPGARTFRSKDGRFEWSGIPPRAWLMTASARGYQRFDLELQLPAGATEIVMPLKRGHMLRGRVYDETSGAGIAAASVSFRDANVGRYEGNFRLRVSTTTSKDGSFVLDGVPAGNIILAVSAQKYAGRELDVRIGEQTSPLQVALSAGSAITGHLVAADGVTPIVGQVSLIHSDGGYGNSVRTSDAGEFVFQRLPAGKFRITGRAGKLGVSQEISLLKDERRDGVVLVLSAGRSIRGVVSGLSPAELERVEVLVLYYDSSRDIERTRVDARGAYEIQGVDPEQVVVRAALQDGRQLSKSLQVTRDTDAVVDFEFVRGARLTGSVTRGGQPLVGVWLQPNSLGEQALVMEVVRTSKRGEYAIENLPPGEYFISSGSYHSRNFTVSGDTVFDIDVPATQLSGRVVEDGGKVPVVGADIYIWSMQPDASQIRSQHSSDHLGEFSFAGMEPGDYVLSAYKPGYELYRERISYGAASGPMTIRLSQGEGVAIRLRGPDGAPVVRSIQVGERIGGRPAAGIRLHLDQNGMAYIPRGMAGSTLTFYTNFYAPAVVPDWSGEELELQLEKRRDQ